MRDHTYYVGEINCKWEKGVDNVNIDTIELNFKWVQLNWNRLNAKKGESG